MLTWYYESEKERLELEGQRDWYYNKMKAMGLDVRVAIKKFVVISKPLTEKEKRKEIISSRNNN